MRSINTSRTNLAYLLGNCPSIRFYGNDNRSRFLLNFVVLGQYPMHVKKYIFLNMCHILQAEAKSKIQCRYYPHQRELSKQFSLADGGQCCLSTLQLLLSLNAAQLMEKLYS